jgi:hypothetical protein
MSRRALAAVCAAHAPNRAADIVGDQQAALFVDGNPDRPAHGVAVGIEESAQHHGRQSLGLIASEGHEQHLIAADKPPAQRS